MKRLLKGLSDPQNRSLFLSGFKDTLPVHLGLVPFAIITGVTAVEFGFSTVEIIIMSVIVFAGAAQLAAIFLMAEGVHIILVVLTVVMINLRFLIYSTSLAPIFQSHTRFRKALYSFLITDPTYALSIPRLLANDEERPHWYYFGSGVSMWLFWILGTALGAGTRVEVPDAFPAELILPIVFIALLFPVVEDRASVATAVVAGGVATAAAPLDYNLGLLAGVSSGLLVGVFLNR